MRSALNQVLQNTLALAAERDARRARARSLIESNDIDTISKLIADSDKYLKAKKGEKEAIQYAMKLKRFIASKNLTSEMVDYVEGK